MGPTPLAPVLSEFHIDLTSLPTGVTQPIPVTTTRRLIVICLSQANCEACGDREDCPKFADGVHSAVAHSENGSVLTTGGTSQFHRRTSHSSVMKKAQRGEVDLDQNDPCRKPKPDRQMLRARSGRKLTLGACSARRSRPSSGFAHVEDAHEAHREDKVLLVKSRGRRIGRAVEMCKDNLGLGDEPIAHMG